MNPLAIGKVEVGHEALTHQTGRGGVRDRGVLTTAHLRMRFREHVTTRF